MVTVKIVTKSYIIAKYTTILGYNVAKESGILTKNGIARLASGISYLFSKSNGSDASYSAKKDQF